VAWILPDTKLPWPSGKDASSRREGYLYWMGPKLYGVKWRNWIAYYVGHACAECPTYVGYTK
jgi:hypothetical protein